jgi:hypothetical protein
MAKLNEILGTHVDEKLYLTDSTLISNSDAIGVELELENMEYYFRDGSYPEKPELDRFRNSNSSELPKISKFWNVVHDGSLRQGAELIFKEPFMAANITEALKLIQTFLTNYRRNSSPISISERCSVHVHSDARDLDDKEILNQLLLYILVERILFLYINPSRSKNNYCRPLTDSSFRHIYKDMAYYSKSGNLENVVSVIRSKCDKYSALNLLTLTKYGSFEYRHMSGTTNMASVLNWINVILAIKVASRLYSISALLAMPPKVLFKSVFAGTDLEDASEIFGRDVVSDLLLKGRLDVLELLDIDKIYKLQSGKFYSYTPETTVLLDRYIATNNTTKPIKKTTTGDKRNLTSEEAVFNEDIGSINISAPTSPRLQADRQFGESMSDVATEWIVEEAPTSPYLIGSTINTDDLLEGIRRTTGTRPRVTATRPTSGTRTSRTTNE